MKFKNLKITIPKDIILEVAVLYLVICEFLPIINLIPQIILSFGKLIAFTLFFLSVYLKDKHLFVKFVLIIGAVVVVHLLAFYNCWCNYTTIGSFLMRNVICWLYMEIGIFIICYASKTTKLAVRNTILLLTFIGTKAIFVSTWPCSGSPVRNIL